MSPRRCPLCRRVNTPNAAQCDCGYTFGQSLGDARDLVKAQLGAGAVTLFGGAVLVALSAGIFVLSTGGFTVLAIGAFVGGIAGIVRGSRLISHSRSSLKELPMVPMARALRDGSGRD